MKLDIGRINALKNRLHRKCELIDSNARRDTLNVQTYSIYTLSEEDIRILRAGLASLEGRIKLENELEYFTKIEIEKPLDG